MINFGSNGLLDLSKLGFGVNDSVVVPRVFGVIERDDDTSSLTGYTAIGGYTGASIVSGNIQLTVGDTSGIAKRINYTNLICAQNELTITCDFSSTANGNGFKLVIYSPDDTPVGFAPYGCAAWFDCNSSGNRGSLKVRKITNGSESNYAISASNLTYTNGQTLRMSITLTQTTIAVSVINTVSLAEVTGAFSDDTANMLKRYEIGFLSNGGTQLVHSWRLTSNNYQSSRFAILSHSMGRSANATNKATGGWANLFKANRVNQVNNFSSGGARITDVIGIVDTEYQLFNFTYTIIHIGTNDAGIPVSTVDFEASLDSLISKIQAKGSIPILCTEIPSTNATKNLQIVAYNGVINSKGFQVIDFYTLLKSGTVLNPIYDSGDGLHPNDAGHIAMFNLVNASV